MSSECFNRQEEGEVDWRPHFFVLTSKSLVYSDVSADGGDDENEDGEDDGMEHAGDGNESNNDANDDDNGN